MCLYAQMTNSQNDGCLNFVDENDEVLISGFGRRGKAKGDIPGVRFKVVKVSGVGLLALWKEKKVQFFHDTFAYYLLNSHRFIGETPVMNQNLPFFVSRTPFSAVAYDHVVMPVHHPCACQMKLKPHVKCNHVWSRNGIDEDQKRDACKVEMGRRS
jgi:hypothetical protein